MRNCLDCLFRLLTWREVWTCDVFKVYEYRQEVNEPRPWRMERSYVLSLRRTQTEGNVRRASRIPEKDYERSEVSQVGWYNEVPRQLNSFWASTDVLGKEHLVKVTKIVTNKYGGEGIMLRQPKSAYEWKRSHTLLKVKLWMDEEAKIVDYKKGNTNPKQRHLICELFAYGCYYTHVFRPSGNKFSIGNGFTAYEHEHPPPIGSIVTFKFQEYTHLGILWSSPELIHRDTPIPEFLTRSPRPYLGWCGKELEH